MAFRLFGFDFGTSVENSFKDLGREMGSPEKESGRERPASNSLPSPDRFHGSPASYQTSPSSSPVLSRGQEKLFGSKT